MNKQLSKEEVLKASTCADCLNSMACERKSKAAQIRRDLEEYGFARFSFRPTAYERALDEIRLAASDMPLDWTDGGVGRARLYGRALLLPWMPEGEDLIFEPGRLHEFSGEFGLEYTQPATVNSVANGKRRVFKPFDKSLYENGLVVDFIRTLWKAVPFDSDTKQRPMIVGMHLVKLCPQGEKPAVASPDLVHRDGEVFTAGLLIDRMNAIGGFNAITHTRWHDHKFSSVPESDVFDKFTLERALEGYVVQDDRVAHYVSPVSSHQARKYAERTILLIDFTPICPDLNLNGIE